MERDDSEMFDIWLDKVENRKKFSDKQKQKSSGNYQDMPDNVDNNQIVYYDLFNMYVKDLIKKEAATFWYELCFGRPIKDFKTNTERGKNVVRFIEKIFRY